MTITRIDIWGSKVDAAGIKCARRPCHRSCRSHQLCVTNDDIMSVNIEYCCWRACTYYDTSFIFAFSDASVDLGTHPIFGYPLPSLSSQLLHISSLHMLLKNNNEKHGGIKNREVTKEANNSHSMSNMAAFVRILTTHDDES